MNEHFRSGQLVSVYVLWVGSLSLGPAEARHTDSIIMPYH
jgi:hypothetical protein